MSNSQFLYYSYIMNESDLKRKQLISLIKKYGFPEEFGCILADELHTEKQSNLILHPIVKRKSQNITMQNTMNC